VASTPTRNREMNNISSTGESKTKMQAQRQKCPICWGEGAEEYKFSDASVGRCLRCGHRFTITDSIQSAEEYTAEYFLETHKNWFNNPNFSLFEKIYQVAKKRGKPGCKILDVGCGTGDLLGYLRSKDKSFDCHGIDLAANAPREGIHFIKGDFLTADYDAKFDLVVSLAVIEHIVDVSGFVDRMRQLCNPDGLVVVMTMNDDCFTYRIARVLFKLGYKTPLQRLYDKHHLNHFSMSSLKDLLEKNGLRVSELYRHNIPLRAIDIPPSLWLVGAVLKLAVLAIFFLNDITGKTFLQTVICTRKGSS
jgi:2-polyprenyl-3-methyl-5-hydroxy-6-metoxy-1,4-benzoquinol methylase